MPSFPRVPHIHGDTDDDASIHLHAQVGPSKPLRQPRQPLMRVDEEILRLVRDNTDLPLDKNIDRYYDLYTQGKWTVVLDHDDGEYESDILSDSTLHEAQSYGFSKRDWDDVPHKSKSRAASTRKALIEETSNGSQPIASNKSPEKVPRTGNSLNYKQYVLFCLISFLLTFLLLRSNAFAPNRPLDVRTFERDVRQVKDLSRSIADRQDILESSHHSLRSEFESRMGVITEKFEAVDTRLLAQSTQYNDLATRFESLKTSTGFDESAFANLEQKLDEIRSIHTEFKRVQGDLVSELIRTLPNHVPVYLKDKKIHILPEFQKYLYSFVENFSKGKGNSTTMTQPANNDLKLLSRAEFEKILDQRFISNNRYIAEKFNTLVDSLSVSVNSTGGLTLTKESNKILLNGLLETFAKGSVKVNYANYNLGARILGFLTKLNLNKAVKSQIGSRSLIGKAFFGWYDYLTSLRARESALILAPKYWKYNANNALLDNGESWQCESNHCSIGVRVFNSIILTDIVIASAQEPREENVPVSAGPIIASLYIKPRGRAQLEKLKKRLDVLKFPSGVVNAENKYLKKFVKIKDFAMTDAIAHLKLPVSIINLRIPTSDIYIEFQSQTGTVFTLHSLKAYGITEFGAYKNADHIDLLVDKLSSEEEREPIDLNDVTEWIHTTEEEDNSHDEDVFFDSTILGDDIVY